MVVAVKKLASRKVFARRVWTSALWGLAVVVVSLLIGMAGYMYFGNMGPVQAFANASMILSGMGQLDALSGTGGLIFEGMYALGSGLVFFAVAGFVLAPALHRLLHSFHIEDSSKS